MQSAETRRLRSMHATVMRTAPDLVPGFIATTKNLFSQNRVSMKSYGLHNYDAPISFRLQDLFPVLEGARFYVNENSRMANDTALEGADTRFTGSDSAGFGTAMRLNTAHHGQVMFSFMGKSDQTGCSFEFVQHHTESSTQHFLHIRTPPAAKCVICPSLVWRSGLLCRACGKTLDDKLLRCGRCWRALCAPVWYCCADCQTADYPRHRKNCGKS